MAVGKDITFTVVLLSEITISKKFGYFVAALRTVHVLPYPEKDPLALSSHMRLFR
jgi:hypothetical protein